MFFTGGKTSKTSKNAFTSRRPKLSKPTATTSPAPPLVISGSGRHVALPKATGVAPRQASAPDTKSARSTRPSRPCTESVDAAKDAGSTWPWTKSRNSKLRTMKDNEELLKISQNVLEMDI